MKKLFLLTSLVVFVACKKPKQEEPACELKDQVCDSALFHLGNQTQRKIYFGFGSNMFDDSLMPGDVRTVKMGRVNVTYDKKTCEAKRSSFATWTLGSSEGTWAFHIDHCNKVSNFRPMPDDTSIVGLFDDTVY